jgi:hypothetical protein
MTERIFELAKQADLIQWDTLSSGARTPDHASVVKAQKFAELIVRECNKISKETCNELKADESIQTPGSKINWNLYNATLRNKLAEHFWVEL